MIYKFVKWDVKPLDTFKKSKEFELHDRLEKGKKINQDHKDWIYRAIRGNGTAIKLGGWAFDFRKWLKMYYVEQYGSVYIRYSFNKTSIRKEEHGRITRIIEV